MFSEELKQLISAALTDGIITEQERMAIKKRAQKESIDPDEIDVYLDSELQKINMEKQLAKGVIKCPACGEIVPPLRGVCPSCGHTISFSNKNTQETSLMGLKKQLDDLSIQYSKKSITFVDFILLCIPLVFIVWIFIVLLKIRKAKDIYAEFNNVLSNAFILYGNDNNAKSYLTEVRNKMEKECKKRKIFVIVAYVIVFGDVLSILYSIINN